MTFADAGFLSPTMDEFRTSVRQVPAYKLWFDYAGDLNQLSWEMLTDHETPTTDNQRLITTALFIRTHQSFQSAIVLIERGMLSDARVVLRSAVEGAIALHAIADDSTFDVALIEAHRCFQRRTANMVLNNPIYRAHEDPEQIAVLVATVADINAEELAAGHKFLDIKWATVASKHCPELYNLLYRSLSNDGTHTNVNAIGRFLELYLAGNPKGLRLGPSTHDLVDIISMACLILLWAAGPFASIHAIDFKQSISEATQRFGSMPREEPQGVSVIAHFDVK